MAERWNEIEPILDALLDYPREERAQRLGSLCRGDAQLEAEVAAYLIDASAAERFIEAPPLAARSWLAAEAGQDGGARVGPYQLLREIGHGGMGVVYLAARADAEYEHQVAVKFVNALSANRELAARFRTERQILANLRHPYIATLLDGGRTPGGLLYFVLEHVDGVPITQYCEERGCTVAERLALFLKVCSAVQYAHQNLVVHRDLKPGNILVTGDGDPKLLDFGIAKILHPDDSMPVEATGTYGLMTPAYASPEQVTQGVITTASDVYALGLLLYELLAGTRAYDVTGMPPPEIVRTICEVEPQPPSVAAAAAGRRDVCRRLKGDLDTIVLMALRKEPARRYSSVEQLAADIERHLGGLPVVARKQTFGYRASKFVAKHRYSMAAAAGVLAAITAGATAAVWQAAIASGERARAERAFGDVRTLANSFLFEFHDAIANLPGSTAARRLAVTRALEYLDRLALETNSTAPQLHELAVAYRRVGDVQGRPYHSNIGDTAGAINSYRRSLAILESLPADERGRDDTALDVSTASERLGSLLVRQQAVAEAEPHLAAAMAIRTRLAAAEPANRERQRLLAESLLAAGDGRLYSLRSDEARAYYRQTLDIGRALVASGRQDVDVLRSLQKAYQRIGFTYEQQAQPARLGFIWDRAASVRNQGALLALALEHHRLALATAHSLAAAQPGNPALRREIADSALQAARVETTLGRNAEGLRLFDEAGRVFDELLAIDGENREWRFDRYYLYKLSASSAASLGRRHESERRYQTALDGFEARWRADQTNTEASIHILETHRMRGDSRAGFGDHAGALASYESALAFVNDRLARDPSNDAMRRQWRTIADRTAQLLAQSGRRAEAAALAQRLLAMRRQQLASNTATVTDIADYAWMLMTVHPRALRDHAEALKYARVSVDKERTGSGLEILALACYLNGDRAAAVEAAARWFALVNRTSDMPGDAVLLDDIKAAIARLT